MLNKIEIYTDGSCIGNPGPGGWAALIFIDGKEVELKGKSKDTTNNRMEMTAIIEAIKWVREESKIPQEKLPSVKIEVKSDSNLIIQTMIQGWKRKANLDLWAQMDKQIAWLDIKWTWVKAHATNKNNNRVDAIAFEQASNA